MLIKPPCSNEQAEPKKKEPKKVEVDFEKYPRPEGSLPGTLAYERPDLLEEWDYEKNNELGLDPLRLRKGTRKNPWWKCKTCSYSWQAYIENRIYKGSSCPACTHQVATSDCNLAILYPNLVIEWDYNNNTCTPDQVLPYSNKRMSWICKDCGNRFLQTVTSRTTRGSGCPICNKSSRTSFPEQALYYYIRQYFNDAKNTAIIFGMEVDIYIPSKNIAIEYDGVYFHKDRLDKDFDKTVKLASHNIQVVRLREEGLSNIENCKILVVKKNPTYKELTVQISTILTTILEINKPDVNIERDLSSINLLIEHKKLANSLENKYPNIAKEFMTDKNGITPDKVSYATAKPYWFKCKTCGYEWLSPVNNRTTGGRGCSICNKSVRLITEDRSLAKLYPEIAKEFMSEKNNITSNKIAAHSGKKYWWKCKTCGHEWHTTIASRTNGKSGCPICNKPKRVVVEDRSLAKLYPELLSEYSSNNVKTANEIAAKSNKTVVWLCSNCNQTYSLRVDFRTSNGTGCPHCHAGYHLEFRTQHRYIDE